MSNQQPPRKINLNNARTAGPAVPEQHAQRPMYDQAADAQRYQSAAREQVRRTSGASEQRHTAYDQNYAQQRAAQQSRAAANPYAQQRTAQQYAQQRGAAQQAQYRTVQQPQPGYTQEQWQAMQMRRAAQQQAQARAQGAARASTGYQERSVQVGGRAQASAPQRAAAGSLYGDQQRAAQAAAAAQRERGGALAQPARSENAPASMRQPSGGPARRSAAGTQHGGARTAGARPQHGAVRGNRGGSSGNVPSGVARQRAAQKKKKTRRNVILGVSITLAVLLVCAVGLRIYLGTIINTGEVGKVAEEIKTPPQFQGKQLNVLVVGIDYTTEDADIVARDPIGMTDMIMYMRFNFEDNTIRMLQIPRDTFVGADLPTGGTGKINALYKCGEDTENRINNLAKVVSEQLQLPIDNYVSIDMESLREIVELFGGIEVYVAQELDYGGSHLDAGWQNLMGPDVEFFLRDRHNFATGDIGRLDNQRYFYSALFRRVRTATWQDIVKLMPVVQKYINTDIGITDCAGLAIKMLKIPSSNIMLCRMPTYDAAEAYNGLSVQVADVVDTADLLNIYFRTEDTQVAAESYTFADWAHGDTPHDSHVQWMNDVDAEGGGSVGDVADAATTGDDVLAQVQAQSASLSASAAPAA